MATPTDKKISDLTPITTLAAGDYFAVYDASDTSKTKNIAYSSILIDEDDMSSDNALRLPSQQSVKAYIDSGTVTMTNKTIGFTAGTAAAGTAPIKLTSGTVNTTPEAGTIEFDGTYFYITI